MASYSNELLEDHHRALLNPSWDQEFGLPICFSGGGMTSRDERSRGLLYWFIGYLFLSMFSKVESMNHTFDGLDFGFFVATSNVFGFLDLMLFPVFWNSRLYVNMMCKIVRWLWLWKYPLLFHILQYKQWIFDMHYYIIFVTAFNMGNL